MVEWPLEEESYIVEIMKIRCLSLFVDRCFCFHPLKCCENIIQECISQYPDIFSAVIFPTKLNCYITILNNFVTLSPQVLKD